MINTIIFSKNRAMQCHALLESINKSNYDRTLFSKFSVIYNYSDASFKEGYEKLIKKFSHINFIEENNFKDDLENLINDFHPYTMFLTDDNILYNKEYLFDLKKILETKNRFKPVREIEPVDQP